MSRRLYLSLDEEEFSTLHEVARAELRSPADQLIWLLRCYVAGTRVDTHQGVVAATSDRERNDTNMETQGVAT